MQLFTFYLFIASKWENTAMLIQSSLKHCSAHETAAYVAKLSDMPPFPLSQSPDFWWKFDLRFGLDCRGTQKWPPDKVDKDGASAAFVPFFWKATSDKLLSWSLPNRLAIYITFKSSRKLPNSLAIFCIFRKLKSCPISTLFLVTLLLRSCFWVSLVVGWALWLPGTEVNPCWLGRGCSAMLTLLCLEQVPRQSFLEKILQNCLGSLFYCVIFSPMFVP